MPTFTDLMSELAAGEPGGMILEPTFITPVPLCPRLFWVPPQITVPLQMSHVAGESRLTPRFSVEWLVMTFPKVRRQAWSRSEVGTGESRFLFPLRCN